MVIVKVAGILLELWLFSCVMGLCRVFEKMPDITEREKEAKSYVAVAIITEVILIVLILIGIIKG